MSPSQEATATASELTEAQAPARVSDVNSFGVQPGYNVQYVAPTTDPASPKINSAIVLSVSSDPALSSHGRPTVSLAFLDLPLRQQRLSGSDWRLTFDRAVVPHGSHASVKESTSGFYMAPWEDIDQVKSSSYPFGRSGLQANAPIPISESKVGEEPTDTATSTNVAANSSDVTGAQTPPQTGDFNANTAGSSS